MGNQGTEQRIQREAHFLLEVLRKTQGAYSLGLTPTLLQRQPTDTTSHGGFPSDPGGKVITERVAGVS